MAELALDHTKRVFDLGTDAGFDLLQLLLERIDWFALVDDLELARRQGYRSWSSLAPKLPWNSPPCQS